MMACGKNSDTGIKETVIKEICRIADRNDVKKVILFGSRARGDYRERSDIDLAVSSGKTACFALDVEEDTSTLLKFDVVDLDGTVQEKLRDSIEKEGRVIYEKV